MLAALAVGAHLGLQRLSMPTMLLLRFTIRERLRLIASSPSRFVPFLVRTLIRVLRVMASSLS
jgi:hypothetical protein